MSKDQSYGFLIFIISIIVAIVYLAAFFSQSIGLDRTGYWHDLAVGIPVLLFVLLVLVISGWIGWTMLTTPPPAPLETEPQPTTTVSKPLESTSPSPRKSRPRRRRK
jgi:predicted DNA-binding transcriptional regulator